MRKKLIYILFISGSILLYCSSTHAQTKTIINHAGMPNKNGVDSEVHSKNFINLLQAEKEQTDTFKEVQPFQSIGIVPINTVMQKNQIEINPFLRYDNYPKFSYHYSGRYSTDYLRMQGTSYGITIAYKHFLKNNLFIKAGLGYYNYRFDKLNNINSFGK